MDFQFQQATRADARARIALMGPSGSGKTWTALAIASGLGDRVAVIDTEHGSAAKYAHRFSFSTLALDSFDPRLFVKAIEAAEQAGFDVIVIDSLSHAWEGKDGALEQIDKHKGSVGGNQWAAWSKVTPTHRELIEAIVGSTSHVIATMRTKTAWEVSDSGKKTPQKIGLAPIQRDGMEYEFDVVAAIDLDHNMDVQKTRYEELDGQRISLPGPELGQKLRNILSGNGQAAPQFTPPAQQHQAAPQQATQAAPPPLPVAPPQAPAPQPALVAPPAQAAPAPTPAEGGATPDQRNRFAALLEAVRGLDKEPAKAEAAVCSRAQTGATALVELGPDQAEVAIVDLGKMVAHWAATTPPPVAAPAPTPVPTVAPEPELVGAGVSPEGLTF